VDLVRELDRKKLGAAKVIVGHDVPADLGGAMDLVVDLPGLDAVSDEAAPVLDVLVGQLLAFFPLPHHRPPAGHAFRRRRDQPRRGGLRHHRRA
jgi:tagatose-6-phosphate ketose/aldose isomerase